jgi:transmembrane sensor
VKPLPIDVRPSEAAVRRMWSAIEGRLERPRRARRGFQVAAAAFAVVAAVALVRELPRQTPASQALTLEDGRPVPIDLTADTRLSDGSTIALAGARVEVLENTPREVTVLVRDGRARFDTQPGRRWIVEAGRARIEVIETAFEVLRDGEVIAITVERGELLVRSPELRDGVRRLTAGASLTLRPEERAVVPVPVPVPPPVVEKPPPVRRAPPERTPPSVERILADADDLRRAGRLDEAVRLLGRVAASPDDPLAGIAWFTRARVLLELGRDDEAVTDLRRAIDAGLPPALEARARARLAELAP